MSWPIPKLELVSEDTFLLRWPLMGAETPSPELAELIGALAQRLLDSAGDEVVNAVPAYHTLMVQYDGLATSCRKLEELIRAWLNERTSSTISTPSSTVHHVPAFYDPKVAPDLERICQELDIEVPELIHLHTNETYCVYAVGFQPDFAYLGYVAAELELPRLASFRATVKAGSVGIADRQTAIYPTDSPGGWQIIARVPPHWLSQHLGELATGDRVVFQAIDEINFTEMGGVLESADD